MASIVRLVCLDAVASLYLGKDSDESLRLVQLDRLGKVARPKIHGTLFQCKVHNVAFLKGAQSPICLS